MYRLATIQSVTVSQMDRRTQTDDIINAIADARWFFTCIRARRASAIL